jgi:DNA-binding transcriptional LysR family regulator
MLDVHRLRLLRELDRRGTLAAVARALSYSPSAISQQLSQLEAEAGVTLLEPAGRGVRLTPLARILVAHTEAILERLEEAEAQLRAAETEVRGTLRVASFQSVLFALIPSVLTRLAERHPGLRVEITHQQAVPAFEGLLAHEFDLVLGEEFPGVARPPVTGARTQLLAHDELFLVLPARGPYALGTQVRGPGGRGPPGGGARAAPPRPPPPPPPPPPPRAGPPPPGGRPVGPRPAGHRPRPVGAQRLPGGRVRAGCPLRRL